MSATELLSRRVSSRIKGKRNLKDFQEGLVAYLQDLPDMSETPYYMLAYVVADYGKSMNFELMEGWII